MLGIREVSSGIPLPHVCPYDRRIVDAASTDNRDISCFAYLHASVANYCRVQSASPGDSVTAPGSISRMPRGDGSVDATPTCSKIALRTGFTRLSQKAEGLESLVGSRLPGQQPGDVRPIAVPCTLTYGPRRGAWKYQSGRGEMHHNSLEGVNPLQAPLQPNRMKF